MRHFSLTQRIKIAYVVSFVLLSLFSMLLLFGAVKQIEDHIFEKQLSMEVTTYVQGLKAGGNPTLPPAMAVYDDINELPERVLPYIDGVEPGIYEIEHPDDVDFHYAVTEFNSGKRLIFLYDVNNIELSDSLEWKISQLIFLGFIVLLIGFFSVFQIVVKRALAPMYQLIEQVKARQSAPEQPIAYHFPRDNELGLLNETLTNYSQRIEAFIEREREFTSFASHELRTPVTVIKGGIALLNLHKSQSDKWQKPINRIDRAVDSMEDMIEMLLSLSREYHNVNSKEVALQDALTSAATSLRDKADAVGTQIVFSQTLQNEVFVGQIPAEIVLSNLLRNAIQHGSAKEIVLNLQGNTVTVVNSFEANVSGETRSSSETGYGLGTVIVERICERQKWQYSSNMSDGKYSATITFSANSVE